MLVVVLCAVDVGGCVVVRRCLPLLCIVVCCVFCVVGGRCVFSVVGDCCWCVLSVGGVALAGGACCWCVCCGVLMLLFVEVDVC